MKKCWILAMSVAVIGSLAIGAEVSQGAEGDEVYLFSSFRGNGEDGLYLAYSRDGLAWKALNNDKPFVKPTVGGNLMRDPCIIQGPDGRFHMVWTTSWGDRGIGVAHSRSLVDWSKQEFVPVTAHEARGLLGGLGKLPWAPQDVFSGKV